MPERATDQELVDAFQAGNDEALNLLLARHQPAIYRFGLKLCRNPEDAEDVLQDTLLTAARSVGQFRGGSSLSTWLYSIARNFCIKRRRGPRAVWATPHSLDGEAPRPEITDPTPLADETAIASEVGKAIAAALRELDPHAREVVILRDIEGLTAPEVAATIGIRAEAVKSRLHRARTELRARLRAYAPHPAARRA